MKLAKIENINTIQPIQKFNESKEPEINSKMEPRKSKSELYGSKYIRIWPKRNVSIITVIIATLAITVATAATADCSDATAQLEQLTDAGSVWELTACHTTRRYYRMMSIQ